MDTNVLSKYGQKLSLERENIKLKQELMHFFDFLSKEPVLILKFREMYKDRHGNIKDEFLEKTAKDAFENGVSPKRIAEMLDVAPAKINIILKESRVVDLENRKNRACELYQLGMGFRAIQKMCHLAPATLYALLRERGIYAERKTGSKAKKMEG